MFTRQEFIHFIEGCNAEAHTPDACHSQPLVKSGGFRKKRKKAQQWCAF
jgi:hypothetical protein